MTDHRHKKVQTREDSDHLSPKDSDTIQDQSQNFEDKELLNAQSAKSLPQFLTTFVRCFRKNEKKSSLTQRVLVIALVCVAFVLLAKILFHENESYEGGHISFNYESPNNQEIKTYASPFLDFRFENPTPYKKIGSPSIEKEDYIPRLHLTCYLYNKDHLNIVIRDSDKARYELPHEAPFPFPKDVSTVLPEESDFILDLELQPFNIMIKRKSTKEVIFSLADRFVYTNLYLEFSVVLPTREIYGLGERISPLQYKDGTYSLFIVDRMGKVDNGVPGFNGQGHHSMYLCREQSDLYHITLFKNIAAQEVVIKDRKLLWKAVGGVYDFHFFLGETPEDVVRKYHLYIGGWTLPALWHMGYQQNKWWGYKNVSHFEYILENFEKAGLPLDVLWSDLDIYEENQNFNYDTKRFPPAETQQLFKKYKKRWIPVVQAYIPEQRTNPCWQYNNGDILKYTVKDGMRNEPLQGYEFSGFVKFIDFLHPETPKFWEHMLEYVESKLPAAGIWLDANEVSNGMSRHAKDIYYKDIKKRKYYKLPFNPGGKNLYDQRLINLDAVHYGGIDEYNVRSLNAFYQSQMTYDYLKKKEGTYFPFVFSRGNMFGMGQNSFHWIPDVASTWDLIRISLGPTMTYQIFGIPLVGADICGFVGHHMVDAELCARWHQVSVFYPFARNSHAPRNEWDNYQEPYVFKGVNFDAIKESMLLRYSMVKQFYTYFFMQPLYTKEMRIGSVMRPLFFEFSRKSEGETLPEYGSKVYEEQFLMLDAIMVAPVLYPGYTNMPVYFPNCKWYDLRNGEEIHARGEYQTIDASMEDGVPHFLRGGKLIFKQNVDGVRSTEDLNNIFNITAALNDFVMQGDIKKSEAVGTILDVPNYSEETIYKQCVSGNCLMNVTIDCSYEEGKGLTVTVSSKSNSNDRSETPVQISYIHLLGAPKDFFNNQANFGKAQLQDGDASEFTFDKASNVLSIHLSDKLNLDNNSNFIFTIKI